MAFEEEIQLMETALIKFTNAVNADLNFQKSRALKEFLENWGSVKSAFKNIEKKMEQV